MPLPCSTNPRRGFSLLEVLVALAVLAVAITGALTGLLAASKELRQGQLRQHEMALVDAKLQRLRLSDKKRLLALALPSPATPPDRLAIGTPPWAPDPTPAGADGDLSTGAYFRIRPDGELTLLTGLPPGTPCNAASLPEGSYCREVALTAGMPADLGAHAGILPAGSSAVTYWVRVARKGEGRAQAVVHHEVIVP